MSQPSPPGNIFRGLQRRVHGQSCAWRDHASVQGRLPLPSATHRAEADGRLVRYDPHLSYICPNDTLFNAAALPPQVGDFTRMLSGYLFEGFEYELNDGSGPFLAQRVRELMLATAWCHCSAPPTTASAAIMATIWPPRPPPRPPPMVRSPRRAVTRRVGHRGGQRTTPVFRSLRASSLFPLFLLFALLQAPFFFLLRRRGAAFSAPFARRPVCICFCA